jgi:hypothetical protein
MASKDVNVWMATDANGRASRVCVADPVKLAPGDTVRWVNKTGGDIIVFFPHDNVLGNSTGHFHHKIAKGATHAHPGAAARQTPPGPEEQYSYSIYCTVTKRFAVGGSDPEIIVM